MALINIMLASKRCRRHRKGTRSSFSVVPSSISSVPESSSLSSKQSNCFDEWSATDCKIMMLAMDIYIE
ncbi:hypothetical protein ES332_D09G253000v1 [Gossypium tomentosum]|uniref:Uncharacterized protein n=1 Tax=Gossypium tomentosum TaxID=34277 RepID=A0A5D2JMH1_GOSTO|nr:hypothetical protein ES332_D09G253000v1 [Gossypium tomentosum]TYH55704.1 hypothetical protein ES332_D09G253000v1 [Gossypium tomentosum]